MMGHDRPALVMLGASILMLLLIGVSALLGLRVPFWCFIVVWLVVCTLLVNRK